MGLRCLPIAGLAGRGVTGRVDDPLGALVGGAVIGTGQWLASRRVVGEPAAWIGASAGGMGVGLLAGAAAVDCIGPALTLCSLEFVGRVGDQGWRFAELLTPIAYIAWSLWLMATGVALLA